jgi:beta-N-acetylhexosaminidase
MLRPPDVAGEQVEVSIRSWLMGGALSALLVAGCSPSPHTADAREAAAAAVDEEAARVDPLHLEPADSAWVERALASLSLRQKAGQVVMPWISGASIAENRAEFNRMVNWVERDQVGGLIVSTGAPRALAEKLNAAQSRAALPLLIVSDLETGPSMRLRPGGTDIPPAMAIGAAGDESLARAAGRLTGIEARAVGIHVTLGPVLDVNSNPNNPIINVRSFGEDPELVSRMASAWIAGAREGGLQAVGKHFPGHGDTETDSHLGLAAIPGDSARLHSVELVPFRDAVRQGMEGVLVGHIAVTGLEGRNAPPASLSPRIVNGLLRNEMGFGGLVITDALNMGGVTRHFSVAEASIRALEAGADILLQPPGSSSVIDAIVGAVQSGRLAPETLDAATRRVLAAKARAGLAEGARVDAAALQGRVGAAEHRAVARGIAERSITLVRDAPGLVPLAPGGEILHIMYTGSGGAGGGLTQELAAAGVRVQQVRAGANSTRAELNALRSRAQAADLVLVSVAIAPHQYRALGLNAAFGEMVESLAARGTPVIAVSMGSPYVLDAFPSVPTYLLAWSSSDGSQRAAARALLGRSPISGRSPVSLGAGLGVGHGLERE